MDYYLYSHSNANGIFYIGKGCKERKRANSLSRRSQSWHESAKNGYTTQTIAHGSNADILSLEKKVIQSLFSQGVNLINKMHNPNWSRDNATRKAISNSNKGNKRPDLVEYNKKRDKYIISCNNRRRWQRFKFNRANSFTNTGCY